jgi:F0F1-type ATP synthase membrane subunit b/b'
MIKAPDVTLIYVIFAFLIAYAILKKFLFLPLSAILEARESEEKTAAKVHAESLQSLSKAIEHIEQELSRARREALKERETLRSEGRAHLEKKLGEAHAAATATLERASAEIESEAKRSSDELPRQIQLLARTLAEKILGRRLAA